MTCTLHYSVTWHKGARDVVYSTRHRVTMLHTSQTLEIPSLLSTDYGEYICRARNVMGTAESICIVKVNKKAPQLDRSVFRGPWGITQ